MTKIKISAALATLQLNLKDSLPDWTANSNALMIQMAWWVDSKLYQTLYKSDPERYMSEQTLSIVDGTNAYSLASDYRSIDATNAGLYDKDSDGNLDYNQKFTKRNPGDRNLGFWVDMKNTNLVMTPVPSTSNSLILRYIPSLTKYTAIADDMLLDEEYEQLLNALLEAMYEAWKRGPNTVFVDEQVQEALEELLNTFATESHVFDSGTYNSYM